MKNDFEFEELIDAFFSKVVSKEVQEQRKEAEKASKELAEVSKIFKGEMVKNGFSESFAEQLLLEIIKNAINKGEF